MIISFPTPPDARPWLRGGCLAYAQVLLAHARDKGYDARLEYGYEFIEELGRSMFSHVAVYVREAGDTFDAGGNQACQRWEGQTPNTVTWYTAPKGPLPYVPFEQHLAAISLFPPLKSTVLQKPKPIPEIS